MTTKFRFKESWKPLIWPAGYEVSNMGRIRRLSHEKPMPRGGIRLYGGKPWIGSWDEKRQRYVFQYKGKTYRVARLVCEAFNGPAPSTGSVCLHIDENGRNNRRENLKWGTQKENLNGKKFLDYCRSRTGRNNPLIKGRKGCQ